MFALKSSVTLAPAAAIKGFGRNRLVQAAFVENVKHYRAVTSRDENGEGRVQEIQMQRFLSKTYLTTGGGVIGYFAAAQLLGPLMTPGLALGGGFIAALGSSTYINMTRPQYIYSEQDSGVIAVDRTARLAAFATLFASFGVMSSPLINYMFYANPTVVGAALFSSVATMAGASAYALTTKRDFTIYGGALTGGLFGLIAVSLGGLGAEYLGYHSFASSMHSLTSYGSIIIFTSLTAYDTQIALRLAQEGQPDHLRAATQFFMNFANLFQAFMSIFYNSDR